VVLALVLVLTVPAVPSAAHPYVFVDAGVEFVRDDQTDLIGIRITWTFDRLTSLFLIEEHGLNPDRDGRLEPKEALAFAKKFVDWDEDFEGDAGTSQNEGL